jgi:predicted DsbA family dithiol-disulfide isomerase
MPAVSLAPPPGLHPAGAALVIVVRVEIWSDVVCPWCYVGKRRFELALATFEHRDDVEVVWRSFELDPRGPAVREGDYVTRLSTKYGMSGEQATAAIDRMVAAGAEDDVNLRFDIARPGNTFNAHRLLHLAHERGVQAQVKERFMRATFTEGEPIGDPDALARVAIDAGLDPSEVAAVLAGDDYGDAVRADELRATQLGISAVPFFVIDGRYGIAGAQSPYVILNVLDEAWADTTPVPAN